MNDQITQTPLALDFYKMEGWHNNLVDFYGNTQKRLPAVSLKDPMDLFTKSMKDVTHIYGKFPEIVYKALGQCIDPYFEEEEYLEKIYNVLVEAGREENRPLLIQYADGLLNIRKLYIAEPKNMEELFTDSINKVDAPVAELNAPKFCNQISNITRIHVNQIRRFIKELE